jgi:hypothetical protein
MSRHLIPASLFLFHINRYAPQCTTNVHLSTYVKYPMLLLLFHAILTLHNSVAEPCTLHDPYHNVDILLG